MAVFKSLGPDMAQNLDMLYRISGVSGQHPGDKLIKISIVI